MSVNSREMQHSKSVSFCEIELYDHTCLEYYCKSHYCIMQI